MYLCPNCPQAAPAHAWLFCLGNLPRVCKKHPSDISSRAAESGVSLHVPSNITPKENSLRIVMIKATKEGTQETDRHDAKHKVFNCDAAQPDKSTKE